MSSGTGTSFRCYRNSDRNGIIVYDFKGGDSKRNLIWLE